MKTLQYWIINDRPSFTLGDISYVQNGDIKKVFCPSCDLLIKGHEFFLTPQNFCYKQSTKNHYYLDLNNVYREVPVYGRFFLNCYCNTIYGMSLKLFNNFKYLIYNSALAGYFIVMAILVQYVLFVSCIKRQKCQLEYSLYAYFVCIIYNIIIEYILFNNLY